MIILKDKIIELLNIFYDNGYEAYVVGGYVRDLIMGKESFDIDVCTNATPREMKEIFNEINLPFENYGSVHLSYKNINFEITTYRMDLEYEDKRKPSKIIYTDKLIIDLRRRDFTINTLCMDKDENIIDLLDVSEDIDKKIIKSVGNADKKLKQDSLRILRAIRFATQLDFEIDIELQNAIINNKEAVKDLSFYRKKEELNKIFSSTNALKGIHLLKTFGIDKYLDINLDGEIVKTNDPIGIWAQVNPVNGYPFTNNEKEYLEAISDVLKDKMITDMELYKYGNYVCYIACQILKIDPTHIYDRYDNLPIKSKDDIDVSAREIINILKLDDKSMVKEIINDLEFKIINGSLKNEKRKLYKYLIDTHLTNVV